MSGNHGGRVAQLYVVGTPIGNLEDVTLRALRVLKDVDVIAAEDTRVVARLLGHHGIARRAVSLHRHNEQKMAERVLEWLAQGKEVALVSDAGTPGICDPGAFVVARARDAGYRVTPIPGPSALAAALSVSGFRESRVLFCGFLPAAPGARRKAIAELGTERSVLVLYEAPHRVLECVEDLAHALGERRMVIARELSKLFESVHVCALPDAADWLRGEPHRTRGEFVLMVSGASPSPAAPSWDGLLAVLLAELPLAQAVRLTCSASRAKRSEVYERALDLQKNKAL